MNSAVKQRLSVEIELSNLATELLEAFSALQDDNRHELDTHRLLKSYIRAVTRCGLAAGRSGAAELQDHCVQFQAILKSLLNQPADQVAQHQQVLEQWPLLLMSSIDKESDPGFIQELDILLAALQQPAESQTDNPASEAAQIETLSSDVTVQTETPDSNDSETGANPELLDELDNAMQALIHLDPATSPTALYECLLDTVQGLQLFAVSAASSEMFGLMDVAQLFQARLGKLRESVHPGDADWLLMGEVHQAMRQYVRAPQQTDYATHLLHSLQQFLAEDSLNDVELHALSKLLITDEHRDESSGIQHGAEIPETQTTAQEPPPIDQDKLLSPAARELLQLIATEFEPLSASLSLQLQILQDSQSTSEQAQRAVAEYQAGLTRFIEVFDSIGLDSLRVLFAEISYSLQHLSLAPDSNPDTLFWLAEWPAYVENYLHDPEHNTDDLLTHIQAAASPVAALVSQAFVDKLRKPDIDTGEDDATPRQTRASDDDVSLALPDDVNPQLLESLLQELPQQTVEFSRVIGNLVKGQASTQDLETAQRLAHTLKGSANTVGVAGIANLTHHIEDILLAFTREKAVPTAPLTTSLQDAADVLEMMSESLVGISPAPQQQALTVLQEILDWANQIDQNGLADMQSPVAAPEQVQQDIPPAPVNADDMETSLRISANSVDETLRLIGESTIVNAQLQESLRRSLAHNRAIQNHSAHFQQLAFELEQLIDVRGMHGLLGGVNQSAFDALEMDQYNELHTLTRRMVEAATDTRALTQYADDELKNLDTLLHQQKRHTKDTQDVIMQTRMLPVQTIVPRLQRSVRQTCRLTGKQAELIIQGSTTLVDNDILTRLADPLMHILRNAVDHGIESPPQREEQGKSAEGRITLDFSREGEHLLIRCQDDGGGLDFTALKRIAMEKDLLNEDAILSDDALARLIFVSGLSTREKTTQMSGRGIGMDAVHNQISAMKGSIRVSSPLHAGLLVEILLPATLVTLHGILARVNAQTVAIANRGVEQILYADDGQLQENDDNTLSYLYKDERYRAYYLEDLLGLPRTAYLTDELRRPAMLLSTAQGEQVAILIERILSTQDVVIKKLGQYAPVLAGVEGVTILGDGSVATVLDLGVMLNAAQNHGLKAKITLHDDGIQSGTPKVLVVDDSLSARTSLAEFMQDSGYRVCTARDGMEAITQLDSEAPDILLVDMEMPRMNGLELSAYVRANQATHGIPIIMITSRSTDKHREEARKAGVNAYLTKPYSESEVLDQIAAQLNRVFSPAQTPTQPE